MAVLQAQEAAARDRPPKVVGYERRPGGRKYLILTKKNNLLLIFTRNPEYGKVKKRLAAEIGKDAALDIYSFLLKHTYSITKNLEVEKKVFYSENIAQNDIWDEDIFQKAVQVGSDLGERMKNAFKDGFAEGFKNIIIIGSDLYDLTSEDLRKAFIALEKSDYVIGPAEDGGYYLLGMKKLNPDIFENKDWGTNKVFNQTWENIEIGQVIRLELRNDIDVLSDVKRHPIFEQFLTSNE